MNKIKDKILIVDDSTENIDILLSLLKNNYEIIASKNGVKSIELAAKVMPDLILLDIIMPEMNGFEVCSKLKENEKTRYIPIIFLTAKSKIDDVLKGFQHGAVDYITKPFNPVELEVRIKTHLELKRSRELLIEKNEKLNLINIQISNHTHEIEDQAEYLATRIKKIFNEKESIDNQLKTVRELIPLIATNDLGSLKVVLKILEESKESIDDLIKEPEEEYFKILSLAIEPLKMAIDDIEVVIKALISIGLIKQESIESVNISHTSFHEVLEKIYLQGKLSAEHYEDFMELARYNVKKPSDDSIILF